MVIFVEEINQVSCGNTYIVRVYIVKQISSCICLTKIHFPIMLTFGPKQHCGLNNTYMVIHFIPLWRGIYLRHSHTVLAKKALQHARYYSWVTTSQMKDYYSINLKCNYFTTAWALLAHIKGFMRSHTVLESGFHDCSQRLRVVGYCVAHKCREQFTEAHITSLLRLLCWSWVVYLRLASS